MKTETEPLLTCKELAGELRKHVSYVYAMRGQGFVMVANLATAREAKEWILKNGNPKKQRARVGLGRIG